MPDGLSPEEQIARAMWLYHAKNPLGALDTMSQVADALSDAMPDDPPERLDALIQRALEGTGLATDQKSLESQFEHLKANHGGFWAGCYTLVDSNGGTHSLILSDDSIRFLRAGIEELASVASEGGGFSNQKLTIDNDEVSLSLSFSTSVDGVDFYGSVDVEPLMTRCAPRVAGALTIKRGKGAGSYTAKGKRDVFTAAGVEYDQDGEPPTTWVGEYQLQYTDTGDWPWSPDTLRIAADSGRLSVKLGEVSATGVQYRNNVIMGTLALPGEAPTVAILQMVGTSGGKRRFYAWLDTNGQSRTATGYATTLLAPAEARRLGRRRVAHKLVMDAAYPFCTTINDVLWTAKDFVDTTSANAKAPSSLFATGGYRVDELDKDGGKTGRYAVYTYVGADKDVKKFPSTVQLTHYQQLDWAANPQPGIEHTVIGIVVNNPRDPDKNGIYELPQSVETDFYNVRLSLLDYSVWGKDSQGNEGATITLATDDGQPHLLELQSFDPSQAGGKNSCPYGATTGTGPDPAVMTKVGDFSKSTALVRVTTGETQVAGFHHYTFAVVPKNPGSVVSVSRQIYKTDGTPDGPATTVTVPFLQHVRLLIDSRDALEVSGTSWPTAVIGKQYQAQLSAMKGQPPYTWRILVDDQRPDGLSWTGNATVGQDVSNVVTFGVSGSVSDKTSQGTTYSPTLRVTNDRSVVMSPYLFSGSITVAQPEQAGKSTWESAVALATILGGAALLCQLGYFLYKHTVGSEDKKTAADNTGDTTDAAKKTLSPTGKTLEQATRSNDSAMSSDDTSVEMQKRVSESEKSTEALEAKLSDLEEDLNDADNRGDVAEANRIEQEMEDTEAEIENESRSAADADNIDGASEDSKATKKEARALELPRRAAEHVTYQ